MPEITIYTTAWCGYCRAATALLDREQLDYEEVSVDDDPHFRQRMLDLSGRSTVPQLVIDGEPIGGFQELSRLVASGELSVNGADGSADRSSGGV